MYTQQPAECCTMEFTDVELIALDDCVFNVSEITDSERSALYFISGYITFKEGLPSQDLPSAPSSIFTDLVSRGKLSHPPEWLLMFSELCYAIYRNTNCNCGTRLTKLFIHMHDTIYSEFPCDINSISRRLKNIFFKGFVNNANDCGLPSLCEDRKLRKLSSTQLFSAILPYLHIYTLSDFTFQLPRCEHNSGVNSVFFLPPFVSDIVHNYYLFHLNPTTSNLK